MGRSGIVALQGQQSFQYGRMKGRGKIAAGANQTANIPEGRGIPSTRLSIDAFSNLMTLGLERSGFMKISHI